MTKIRPFKAIRPTRDKAYLVATRPYYMYKNNVLEAKLESNPYTFLHVINPEFHEEDRTDPNSVERFKKVRGKFDSFFEDGIFIQDNTDSLYLYKQTKDGNEFLGLIGGAAVEQYNNGHIKKHEETITSREETFSEYLKIVLFNAEPVLLFHERKSGLDGLLKALTLNRPEYEFSSTERIKHEIWVINNAEIITEVQNHYNEINDVYIADGHHRCASSARFSNEISTTEDVDKDYFLAYFISEERMEIMDYNRMVSDLNGLSTAAFLNEIEKNFAVSLIEDDKIKPQKMHEMSMYLDKKWYKLNIKEGSFDKNHPVENLDTHILTQKILNPILNIQDLKTDQRIDFINGKKGLDRMAEIIDSGEKKLGFALYPVSVEDLKKVADNNMIMPPKSTWIEPKLRSGLTIYPLD